MSMFEYCISTYSLKKALARKLKFHQLERLGWTMEDEHSHYLTNGDTRVAEIYEEAIKQKKILERQKKARQP